MIRLDQTWQRLVSDKDRRPIWEWLRDFVTLYPPLTRTGKFETAGSSHFLEPLAALQSDEISEVNILAPVRSGKTLIGDAWLDWTVVNDPGPFRVVMQDDQVAKEHAESRTMKQLKSIPGVEFLLPSDRHKERGQEIIFPNGHHLYVQGPALNKLQSKGFRYIWVDEPWLPTVSKNFGEIKGRLGDYERMRISKLLCTGQGGVSGDPWHAQCKAGEWREWMVKCEACGHYQAARFSAERGDGTRWGIVWDEHKDANGYWDVSACATSARFECEACKHRHEDGGRVKEEWNRTGRYETIGPANARKKTFHWTAVIDYPWANLVEQFLQARNVWRATRDSQPTIVFWQKRMAEFKDERDVHDNESVFKIEKYEPSAQFPGEVARVITIDRQQEDLFWVLVRSWIVNEARIETRRLWFGKCFSFEEIDAKAKEFKVSMKPLCDSGFRAKGGRGVYAACIKFGWIATKGVGGVSSFMHLIKGRRVYRSYAPRTSGDSETPLGNAILYRFSVPAMADLVQGMIDAGTWIEPEVDSHDPIEVAYKRQMRGDALVPTRNRFGAIEMKWKTIDDENHAWDCSKQQALAAVIGRILPDPFNVRREIEEEEKEAK